MKYNNTFNDYVIILQPLILYFNILKYHDYINEHNNITATVTILISNTDYIHKVNKLTERAKLLDSGGLIHQASGSTCSKQNCSFVVKNKTSIVFLLNILLSFKQLICTLKVLFYYSF